MSEFVFRLWAHWAEDGILPEITVHADTQIQAAAVALHYFIGINRPLDEESYLQCEMRGSQGLTVQHVLDWLRTPDGRSFSKDMALTFPSFPLARTRRERGNGVAGTENRNEPHRKRWRKSPLAVIVAKAPPRPQ